MNLLFSIFETLIFGLGSIFFLIMSFRIIHLKVCCKHKIEATIDNYKQERKHRGPDYYVPIYKYTFNGTEYEVEGWSGFFDKNDIPSKMDILIDEKQPSHVCDFKADILVLNLMMFIFCFTMLITSIILFGKLNFQFKLKNYGW